MPNGTDCTITYETAGAACDDGELGTHTDACDGSGSCAGTPYSCAPGTCEASSVPNGTDCTILLEADGSACDAGDLCFAPDTCQSGVCTQGAEITCDDLDACTRDWCDAALGCQTEPDHCGNGSCDCGEAWQTCRDDCAGPGDLDVSFGAGGFVLQDFLLGDDEARDLAVFPDESVVVGGRLRAAAAPYDFLLAAYTADGALDTAFGAQPGFTTTDLGANGTDRIQAIALDLTRDRVVAAGHGTPYGGTAWPALAVYGFDGVLDTTFMPSGSLPGTRVESGWFGSAGSLESVVVLDDGGLVVGGSGTQGGGSPRGMIIARYDLAGAPVLAFDGSGFRILDGPYGGDERGGEVIDIDRGAFLLGGSSERGYDDDLLTFAVDAVGADDTTWAGTGVSSEDLSAGTGGGSADDPADSAEQIHAVAVDGSDRLLVVGAYYPQTTASDWDTDFFVARYTTAGVLDTTFGTGGWVAIDFGGGAADRAHGVALQADGKIVLCGESRAAGPTDAVVAAARIDATGALDPSFGMGGITTITPGAGGHARAYACAVQGTRGILVAGDTDNGTDRDLLLLRLLP